VRAHSRARAEIDHGKRLSLGDPELTWGWGTEAGRLRARRRADLIARGARLAAGMRALEIGCGTGMFTEMFAESRADLVAVDISEELLARARARGIANARFLARPFEECDVEGPFDAVIGSSVLHHLAVGESIARIFALLRPGGRLSFAEPNYLNPQVFLERKLRFIKPLFWHVSPDETAFVRWWLGALLAKAGFEDIRITPFDWLHPSTPPGLIRAVLAVGSGLERTPLLREFSGSLHITAGRPG
jgi:2-polyprenyl-3-methyl-5-hydroxy-6-metoxy-1,4-benzoquinol methylase